MVSVTHKSGAVLACCYAGLALALPEAELGADALIDFPLEELMQMEATVSSVSKREESLKNIPAAIFVVTREDIRRSAATSVPDALRMVPGLQVAKISASEWAVSARGLGGRFSRYLLVLIDGRSIYTSLFSGVNWDEINLSLENIERIEVVRGPGGTIWGANAVNGMVNIITRRPGDTHASRLRASAGQGESEGSLYASSNLPLSSQTALAISGHVEQFSALDAQTSPFEDKRWRNSRLDLALETERNAHEVSAKLGVLAIDSDIPWAKQQLFLPDPAVVYGDEHKQGYYGALRWRLRQADGLWTGRLSYDATYRDSAAYDWNTVNWDAELQWAGELAEGHSTTLGLAARQSESQFVVPPTGMDALLTPANQDSTVLSGYLQDTWQLTPAWALNVGVRYDDNSFTKSAIQPSLRSLWSVSQQHTLWLAASRANSTPSRLLNSHSELAIQALPPSAQNPLPSMVILASDGLGIDDVALTAYEAGYRFTPAQELSVDATLFRHNYRNIMAADTTFTPELRFQDGLPYLALPLGLNTDGRQHSVGLELSVRYQPTDAWYLQYSGAYIDMTVKDSGSAVGSLLEDVIDAPEHQHSLRSLWNAGSNWELDTWLRHVPGVAGTQSETYTALDVRINFRYSQQLHLSLGARNLFANRTVEADREIFSPGSYAVPQSVVLKIEWQSR